MSTRLAPPEVRGDRRTTSPSSAVSTSATTAGTTADHKDPNPLRVSRGEPHKPFHDMQAYLVGRDVLPSWKRCSRAGGRPPAASPWRSPSRCQAGVLRTAGSRAACGHACFAQPDRSPWVAHQDAELPRDLRSPSRCHRRRGAADLHRDAILQLARDRRSTGGASRGRATQCRSMSCSCSTCKRRRSRRS